MIALLWFCVIFQGKATFVDTNPRVTTLISDKGHDAIRDGTASLAQITNIRRMRLYNNTIFWTEQNVFRKFVLSTNEVSTISNDAGWEQPSGIAKDPRREDLFFLSDTGTHSIRRLNLSTGEVQVISGDGTTGFNDGTSARYKAPISLEFGFSRDNDTILLIAERFGTLRTLDVVAQNSSTLAGLRFETLPGPRIDGNLKTARFGFINSAFTRDLPGNDFEVYILESVSSSTALRFVGIAETFTIQGFYPSNYNPLVLFGLAVDIQNSSAPLTADTYISDPIRHAIFFQTRFNNGTVVMGDLGQPGNLDGVAFGARFTSPSAIIYVRTTETLYIAQNRSLRLAVDGTRTPTMNPTTLTPFTLSPTPELGCNIVPQMTSNTAPCGTVLTDSNQPFEDSVWTVFSRGASNQNWESRRGVNIAQIQYNFKPGTTRKVTRYGIRHESGINATDRAPRNWTLLGTNDTGFSTIIDIVDQRSEERDWFSGEWRFYEVASPDNYSEYRFAFSQDNNDEFTGAAIALIEIREILLEDTSRAPGACERVCGEVATSTPTTEAPVPGTGAPSTAPTTLGPITASPLTTSPLTASPVSASPVTGSPLTTSPLTTSPVTQAPSTDSPSSSPSTATPITVSPATLGPSTGSPSSLSPATASPETSSPTAAPLTSAPTVVNATLCPTSAPGTASPATLSPLTSSPGTFSPTSASPTAAPQTLSPATGSPRTSSPLTASPATLSPLTASPTPAPLTSAPTVVNATLAPTGAPATDSPATGSPFTSSPASNSPATSSPLTHTPSTGSPATSSPETGSPSSSPATPSPTRNPATAAPTLTPFTRSPSLPGSPVVIPDFEALFASLSGKIRATIFVVDPNSSPPSQPYPPGSLDLQVRYQKFGSSLNGSVPLSGDAVIDYLASQLPGTGLYDFIIRVIDLDSNVARTVSERVEVLAPPSITNFTVYPQTGFAFETRFLVNTSATGTEPLSYRYSYIQDDGFEQERVLSGLVEGLDSLTFILSVGVYNVSVTVEDSLGGFASDGSLRVQAVQRPNVFNITDDITDRELFYACVNISSTVGHIRSVLKDMDVVPDSVIDAQDIYTALNGTFDAANQQGEFELELRSAVLCLRTLEDILQTSDLLSACESVGVSLPISNSTSFVVGVGEVEDQTFTALSETIWLSLSRFSVRAAESAPNTNGTVSLFITQVVRDIANSTSASDDVPGVVKDLVDVLEVTQSLSPPSLLTDTKLGNESARAINDLLSLTLKTSENTTSMDDDQTDICSVLDRVSDLMDTLLQRAGSNLLPSGPRFNVIAESLEGSSVRAFTDVQGGVISNVIGGVDVRINATSSTSGSSQGRPSATVNINNFRVSLGRCRSPPSGSAFRSGVTSVTVADSAFDEVRMTLPLSKVQSDGKLQTTGENTCQFYDITTKSWSSKGCRLEEIQVDSNGLESNAVCICNHLTEFAVLRNQINDEDEDDDAQSSIYGVLAGLYALLMLLAAYALFMAFLKKKSSARYDQIKSAAIFGQTLLRVPLCVLLSGLESGYTARSVPLGAVLVLFALPHNLMWCCYGLMIYQWGAVSYHTRKQMLVRDMFSEHIWIFYVSMAVVSISIWVSFGLFLFYSNDPISILGPVVMFLITLGFAFGVSLLGRETLSIMSRLKKKVSREKRDAIVIHIHFLTAFLVTQSLIWIIASVSQLDEASFLTAMVAFYLADMLMVFIQVDFIRGFKVVPSLVKVTSIIFKSSSSRSDGTDSGGSKSGRNARSARSDERSTRSKRTPDLESKLDNKDISTTANQRFATNPFIVSKINVSQPSKPGMSTVYSSEIGHRITAAQKPSTIELQPSGSKKLRFDGLTSEGSLSATKQSTKELQSGQSLISPSSSRYKV